MAAIAGIARPGQDMLVNQMLDRMAHRGPAGRFVRTMEGVTLGVAWGAAQTGAGHILAEQGLALDSANAGHFAQALAVAGRFVLKRDPLGVAPLYYGHTSQEVLCFASEVKGLLGLTKGISELPPGCLYKEGEVLPYFQLACQPPLSDAAEVVAQQLRLRLEQAIGECDIFPEAGSWLSGGLDSSVMAALARRTRPVLHTFAAGTPAAPDLSYARIVADFIGSHHHEVVVSLPDLLAALPQVIYHLESFDALLVRSSLTNYLVARRAAEYVPAVFSGEGGDELFAGYEYLKRMDTSDLPSELVDIATRLHNTALQRVDRCASAHGTVALVGFLDPTVVEYALRIPAEYKLHQGVEKWVLRQAVTDLLPDAVLNRTKAKFWEGAGVSELVAQCAEEQISESEFRRERRLPGGGQINSREELLYYRIFREHFGTQVDLNWMGRTKGAPVEQLVVL